MGGISNADMVRAEICVAVAGRHQASVTDDDLDRWETVADVATCISARCAMSEAEVLAAVQKFIAAGWSIPQENVAPESRLFHELNLANRPFKKPCL